ncbi:A24 family peptidase [Virgibacillus sp. W0430]|uniref:A24 family peptidase n=1 Tax=Virgibacillus sp. W0430 TaxID=3391580 RepID=UPI003F4681A9
MVNAIVIIMLIICIVTDLRERKILNAVTLPASLLAFIYHAFTAGLDGFLFSGKGFLVGFALLIIPYAMGGIGAGDVKLLAAIGAWKGMLFVLYAGLYGAAVGGIIAFIILLKRKQFRLTIKSIFLSCLFLKSAKGSLTITKRATQLISIPYAIPIAIGALCTYILEIYI